MKITYEELGPGNPAIIAEFACGHEGKIDQFFQLVDSAKRCGVNIIKSQIFIPEERATPEHPEWKVFNDLCFTESEWRDIAQYVKKQKIYFFADIFGERGLEIARAVQVDGYKVHSEDLLNYHFIAEVLRDDKITLIGVGGAHRVEIYELLLYLKKNNLSKNIVLMPGVQTFPTPVECHSLEEISDLYNKYGRSFNVKVGCADHIDGSFDLAAIFPMMALSEGACLLEKHFTVNREVKWEDYESALGEEEFMSFVSMVKKTSPWFNRVGHLTDSEKKYRKRFKKTPTFVKAKKSNDVMSTQDFRYTKSAEIKVPLSSAQIENSRLVADVKGGEYIRSGLFHQKVGAVIVVRCNSTRLLNKALLPICQKESIVWLIDRIKRCENISTIILATSTDESDDKLEEIALREGICCFRGDADNVSERIFKSASVHSLDHIVRITGDDLVRDEVMIDRAIASHLNSSCDVTITTNMPYGCQTEIFSYRTIKTIYETVVIARNTEYLEWFLQNDRLFSVNFEKSNYTFDPQLRLTLDYEEDLEFFETVFKSLRTRYKNFTLQQLLDWVEENPSVLDINKFKMPKYKLTKTKNGMYESDELELKLEI
ncbi:MAG: N-acetylneuraminate synthase family protein [Gammaproteobacteria bacterium]|nr:N-acetylneuraminate synthase family protein [Gammaproteobacteria bacterium]MCH9743469.1 N-acetylneuraminate synthase family protein [Gammaproteobacteria bacterium]